MADAVRIAVTGAAGQIGYALVFRIASGQLLGDDAPVQLRLLEIPPAMDAVKGVIMELEDCAFPLLDAVEPTDDPNAAFDGADIAILVGARPRTAGMERGDLLEANAAIFSAQGAALNARASRRVKVLVVGNPANTNCLIAQRNAPDLDPRNFTAMMRLDHNRAKAQLAAKTGARVDAVRGLAVWGNHSATQYPTCITPPWAGSRHWNWSIRLGTRTSSFRRCSSAGRPSSPPAALRAPLQPPTPSSNTSAIG